MKFINAFLFSMLYFCVAGSAQNEKNPPGIQSFGEPLFFIDSVKVPGATLQSLQPTDIAMLNVYKDSSKVSQFGAEGKNGVIYIETKKFVRTRYWNLFKSKSIGYAKAVPHPNTDSTIVYFLNGKILENNLEDNLSKVDAATSLEIKIIDKQTLLTDFAITGKRLGVLISTKNTEKKIPD